jgi:hypothetical protein
MSKKIFIASAILYVVAIITLCLIKNPYTITLGLVAALFFMITCLASAFKEIKKDSPRIKRQ